MHALGRTCLLVALDGGGIAFQFDDFTNKFVETDSNEFVHGGTGHVIGDDHYRVIEALVESSRVGNEGQ